jgi:cation diffusion facilitator CzcD-associated flavoprotein CzcO
VGLLSEPTCPNIPGVSDFKGEAFHSSRWPNEGDYSLKGKRCGVIGTGATGIQIIQSIVKPEYDIKSLTVFQRTPNWSAPLRNEPITPEQMNQIRQKYPEIFEACSQTAAGFIYAMDQRKTIEVPEKEVVLRPSTVSLC